MLSIGDCGCSRRGEAAVTPASTDVDVACCGASPKVTPKLLPNSFSECSVFRVRRSGIFLVSSLKIKLPLATSFGWFDAIVFCSTSSRRLLIFCTRSMLRMPGRSELRLRKEREHNENHRLTQRCESGRKLAPKWQSKARTRQEEAHVVSHDHSAEK